MTPFAVVIQVFQAMFDRMGMGDLPILVSLVVQKLSNNLRYRGVPKFWTH